MQFCPKLLHAVCNLLRATANVCWRQAMGAPGVRIGLGVTALRHSPTEHTFGTKHTTVLWWLGRPVCVRYNQRGRPYFVRFLDDLARSTSLLRRATELNWGWGWGCTSAKTAPCLHLSGVQLNVDEVRRTGVAGHVSCHRCARLFWFGLDLGIYCVLISAEGFGTDFWLGDFRVVFRFRVSSDFVPTSALPMFLFDSLATVRAQQSYHVRR